MSHRCSSSSSRRPNVFINARRWNQLNMQTLENRKTPWKSLLKMPKVPKCITLSHSGRYVVVHAGERALGLLLICLSTDPIRFPRINTKGEANFFSHFKVTHSLTYTLNEKKISCWSSSLILIAWRKRLSFHETQLKTNDWKKQYRIWWEIKMCQTDGTSISG